MLKPGSVRLGYTDFTLSEPTTALFLASTNGRLRVWADGKLIHQCSENQPFQPDSDRFQTDLGKGSHRLTLELASAASSTEFHLRFRRKSSSLEHEQLVQMALTREEILNVAERLSTTWRDPFA